MPNVGTRPHKFIHILKSNIERDGVKMYRNLKYAKERKQFINGFIDLIENGEEYKDYTESNKKHKEDLEKNSAINLWSILFFETYDNFGINQLIKSISKLDKKYFEVKLNYRKKRLKDLQYLELQYDHTSVSSLARIKVKKHNYIRNISISFAQINNNQAIVKFEIEFNKIISQENYIDFIKTNMDILYNKKFIDYYDLKYICKSKSLSTINQITDELFKSTLQAFLAENIFLSFGKIYNLPTCAIYNYPKGMYTKETFKDIFLCTTYHIRDGEQYLVVDNIRQSSGTEMGLYFEGSTYKPLYFMGLISKYRMNFYYFLFGNIENCEFNLKMNKYYNTKKNKVSSKDYKWLVNRLRAIKDNKLHDYYKKRENCEVNDWIAYRDNEEIEINFIGNDYSKRYETIYSECLEHVKFIYSLQKESLILKIATWTLVATLTGIGLAIAIAALTK